MAGGGLDMVSMAKNRSTVSDKDRQYTLDEGFIDFIINVDFHIVNNFMVENILDRFVVDNKNIASLISNYPKNIIREFDFPSTYKPVIETVLHKQVDNDYVKNSFKWLLALKDYLRQHSHVSVSRDETSQSVDYPSEAYVYRGNTHTPFFTSNGYYADSCR